MVKVAIIYYSMYGHVATLARAEQKGIEAAGGKADLFRVDETLPKEVLAKMHAPETDTKIHAASSKTFEEYDAFLFGIPTRYGNYSAQWKALIDHLGGLWMRAALQGKYFGLFISTGTLGGGQESTAIAALSTWVHMGMIYVSLGYRHTPQFNDVDEVRGGSPWGAGTFSKGDGSRQPSESELQVAEAQGKYFYETVSKVKFA